MKRQWCMRLAAFILLIISCLLTEWGAKTVPAVDREVKLAASERTKACCDAIKSLKQEMGIAPDETADINRTGMLGQEYSFITTTLGNLEAKRTAVNPNMAAVVVDMFHELGLKSGDLIGINCSGSFPALNIAVTVAAEELGLKTLVMSSYGASTHGANDPELTYPDMEAYLNDVGLLRTRSDYVSIGGMEDMGKEMPASVKDEISERLLAKGYVLFTRDDLMKSIADRYDIYRAAGSIKCFVNVGGNDVSFGDSMIIVHADGGILTSLPDEDTSTGLVQLFLKDGIPVIHLLNIKSIAGRYGLPIDPVPLPQPGEGGVYNIVTYNKWPALAGFVLAVVFLYLSREKDPIVFLRRAGKEDRELL